MNNGAQRRWWLFGAFIAHAYSAVAFSQGHDVSEVRVSEASAQRSISDKAKMWRISEADYRRYTDIIEGPLKHWNPTIDPVLALGIFAESDAEQTRFAEIYARQEYELVTKTQAFERVYREAFMRLYPDAKMISAELMAPYHSQRAKARPLKNQTLQARDFSTNVLLHNDRVLYFVDVACDDCQQNIDQLQALALRKPSIFVDFYLLGISNDDQARHWAAEKNIDVSLVNRSQLTINLDEGVFEQLSASSERKTAFFLHRDGNVFAVSGKELFLQ